MKSFDLKILAVDKPLYDGPCVSLTVQLADGSMGFLPGHADAVCAIVPGVMTFKTCDAAGNIILNRAAVSEGLLVFEDNRALVLADTADMAVDIDKKRAERDIEEARTELRTTEARRQHNLAEGRLARALSRLEASKSL